MYKELTLKEFRSLNLNLNNYNEKEIKLQIEEAETVNKFHPAYPVFSVEQLEDKTGFSYKYSHIKLVTPLDCRISYSSYHKKWNIGCWSYGYHTGDFQNINSNTITQAEQKFKRPQNIGVLTTKKINEWINFFTAVYKELAVIDQKNKEVKETFLKSLDGLTVNWSKDNTSGRIVKNGLEYRFEIEPTYISERILLNITGKSDLNTFIKLSDNKYLNSVTMGS